ncbi:MAG: NUDIX domain-containing protein [Candidatus Aenigmarchaeota archaeon]|nr:NUDIX domain-containing protein [Candidatus Aenigmarchaeota archaeon]
MQENRPKVGLGVIVKKDDKVLLLRRKGSHGEGSWCFPGGHLENMETFEDCAKRETMEEAGIVLTNTRFAGVTNDFFPEGKHYVTIFMYSDWKSGEARICEPDKCEEIGWFMWNALPQPLFLSTENFVKQYIRIGQAADLTNMFGVVKSKMSGQKFKDMVRKGWKP